MNAKNMTKALNAKMRDWLEHIDDEKVIAAIKADAMITGGALVSLLNSEEPNDYDIYFKTVETCKIVADYYANWWNTKYPEKPRVKVSMDEDEKRVRVFVSSVGAAMEDGENGIDDPSEPFDSVEVPEPEDNEEPCAEEDEGTKKPKYRPRYFSSNAISLSDKIQIVIRFTGSIDEIHENYDYVHCTCSFDFKENKVNLPTRALEAIINKELFYTGSKYPLCSIIRSRKFIERGWHINAGQYLKMCLQLNELDLKDLPTFRDQLVGVDSAYFDEAIRCIEKRQEEDPDFKVDNTYLFEIINRIF